MTQPLALPSELTIYTVSDTKLTWLTWLNAARAATANGVAEMSCSVDAATVDEIDAAGVQLLLSFANALDRSHLSLTLTNPSTPLIDACRALGVGHLLSTTRAAGVIA
jgi:ABC-type transporter Mla MlaB component